MHVKCFLGRVRKYISGEKKNDGKFTATKSNYDTGVDSLYQMSKSWNVLSWLAAASSWSRKHVGLYNDGRVEIRTQWNEGKGERLEASHLFHHIRRRTEATARDFYKFLLDGVAKCCVILAYPCNSEVHFPTDGSLGARSD